MYYTGELFVHFSSATPQGSLGFETQDNNGVLESNITMYYESSSYGLGLNDSWSLAPPLRVHAIRSPLDKLLVDEENLMTMIELNNTIFMASSGDDAVITTPHVPCQCNHINSGVHILVGAVNYPYYGHVLTNTLSNLFALLYLKRIDPQVT